ncbi:ABC transporter substrate-binding protein [Paraburkholderia tuberum]|uniref:NitT/TauT family transport system substrate-binding protein n=1 Tax=Paraburkholderia tuberum TaxID=157910 RepID=A0A1H1HDN1_9BURK|nr:ABC transporter substrate-binding protein [Paraburkholderia tuberum]SDR23572.1 NitT/TauT family transport system substrate-binding protein [Paraburkholderia tuberum]
MKRLRAIPFIALLCAGSAALPGTVWSADLTPIRVSYQPALYWALPFYVATEKGWWAEVGLKPEFSVFPAGVPQIAAAASKSWDVGGTGSVPAVLGYQRFGIQVIGLTNDESQGNVLMASKARYDAVRRNPASLKGQTIVLTSNSTGDYAVQACLKKYGLTKADVTLKNMGQAEIISAVSSGNADYAGVWAPYDYTLEEKAGARVLCSGKDGGASVPGALVTRGEFEKQHPDEVAKFLAVYLHAWAWMKAHPDQAVAMMKKFYQEGGVNISDDSMRKEFATRPTFDLKQQLAAMDRTKGASQADDSFTKIAQFMHASGALASVPEAKDYIDDSAMKRVLDDPKLAAFAMDGSK